ncbi:hypothetical protein FSO04_42585 [Paraburkholderia madseniana]|jgi:hypothetical protein|uniref:Uncharacterized protein n=1 Tax=Paraburkholderia madseniana TaxID=2599607 RepID=A0A6N6W295_9BURK|nr:hypothetical protein [Paraburkholderia madseniana]KAE8753914.1 hypothetical protein FSO04_42585 [Paraburkholderia madseniana]
MTTQRLTVSAAVGTLHVIAIWQSLQECAAEVCAWTADVDAQCGAESLTLEFADLSAVRLQNVVATLNDSMFPMKASITHTPEA